MGLLVPKGTGETNVNVGRRGPENGGNGAGWGVGSGGEVFEDGKGLLESS